MRATIIPRFSVFVWGCRYYRCETGYSCLVQGQFWVGARGLNEWAGTLRETEKVREREGKCMWPGVPVLIVGIINYSSWT